ncbi:MAG: hypothetical protein GY705_18590 [Bacteroidetes bacterium]|nr:hypothetical protein [Bacteroidota bacterium]
MLQTVIENFPNSSKVWIFQASRPFNEKDVPAIRQEIKHFANSWASHNVQLSAYGDLLHRRFIILIVDESQIGASGCSIDTSVSFIKTLEKKFGIELFDRMRFSFKKGEEIHTVSRETFRALYREGEIDDNTLVFDTLVSTKEAFEKNWLKTLSSSWHKRML